MLVRVGEDVDIHYLLFSLGHSPTQFEIKPEIPDCNDRDRDQICQILIDM